MKRTKTIIAGVLLYLVSTGVSFATFNYLKTSPQEALAPLPTTSEGALIIDPNAPKNEVCPINGAKYTDIEKKAWSRRRPLTIMIENHLDSRPQSGLSETDVIYETVAEGGITRFLAVFYCDVIAKDTLIGPIRSARTYFLDWASEYGKYPLYVHVGGANVAGKADALGQIQKYGWGGSKGNDINQFSVGYPTFWRDYERLGRTTATEHTMMSTSEKLWQEAEKRSWTNKSPNNQDWLDDFTSWKFDDDSDTRGSTSSISFDFWEGFKQYDVRWEYDSETNSYKRFNGGESHPDQNTSEQLTAKNIVIQFTTETGPIDELKHMLYGTIGSGEALIFQNGEAIKATWKKESRTARTLFFDKKGKEIKFVRGRIWIEILADGTDISY
jgi:hypothetical protein